MPAVGDLLRVRRSLLGSICKRASAIPADDLHTRMGLQPLFEGLGFSIRQHVDGNPPFKVDEDRSIAPASAKAKIVYTQHTRCGCLALLLLTNQPQEPVRTGLYPHSINQALACFPSQSQPDEREEIRQARGSSGIGSYDAGQTWSRRSGVDILYSGRKSAAHAVPAAPPNPPKANPPHSARSASGYSRNDSGKADKTLLRLLLRRRRE